MMSSKRKPTSPNSSSKLKFMPGQEKNDPKGTKPTVEKFSVQNVLLMMLQHCCRKLLFIDVKLRVFAYLAFIFIFSVLVDVLPLPKALQSFLYVTKGNFLNRFFVKVGWGWTLLLGLPFCALTSFVYCCGRRERVLKNIFRFAIATFFWYFWTNVFLYIESVVGRCNVKDSKYQSKSMCIGKGFTWTSIDISGHCFILLYSALLLIEECRVINCWEGIADLIREEDYIRSVEGGPTIHCPMRSLSADEFQKLKAAYPKLTPYIRTLFILITALVIIWDIMLVTTVIFYHNMIEKLIAAFTAIISWYITYYLWFPNPKLFPPLPGEGLFKYKMDNKTQSIPLKKQASFNRKAPPGPRFMGMPLRVPEDQKNTQEDRTS